MDEARRRQREDRWWKTGTSGAHASRKQDDVVRFRRRLAPLLKGSAYLDSFFEGEGGLQGAAGIVGRRGLGGNDDDGEGGNGGVGRNNFDANPAKVHALQGNGNDNDDVTKALMRMTAVSSSPFSSGGVPMSALSEVAHERHHRGKGTLRSPYAAPRSPHAHDHHHRQQLSLYLQNHPYHVDVGQLQSVDSLVWRAVDHSGPQDTASKQAKGRTRNDSEGIDGRLSHGETDTKDAGTGAISRPPLLRNGLQWPKSKPFTPLMPLVNGLDRPLPSLHTLSLPAGNVGDDQGANRYPSTVLTRDITEPGNSIDRLMLHAALRSFIPSISVASTPLESFREYMGCGPGLKKTAFEQEAKKFVKPYIDLLKGKGYTSVESLLGLRSFKVSSFRENKKKTMSGDKGINK